MFSTAELNIPTTHIAPDDVQEIQLALTLEPRENPAFTTTKRQPLILWRVEDKVLIVPRYYRHASLCAEQIRPEHVQRRDEWNNISFCGELRHDLGQNQAVEKIMENFDQTPPLGASAQLPCGFGKTVVALYVCGLLQCNTLIVVPTSVLVEQWHERIQTFLPSATVGVIQGAPKAPELLVGVNLLITTVHTLSKGIIPDEVLQSRSFTIVDEMHTICAPTFSLASRQMYGAYRLGLSATPYRPDGLHKALSMICGELCFKIERPPDASTTVLDLRLCAGDQKEIVQVRNDTQIFALPQMINALAADDLRFEILALVVEELACAGRKILVLSDRLSLTDALVERLKARLSNHNVNALTGKVPKRKRNEALLSDVIIATTNLCKTGLDQPRLDCVVFATPFTNPVEQAVGRVQRPCPGKRPPLIIDIHDAFSIFDGFFTKRKRFYDRQGFGLRTVSVTNYKDCIQSLLQELQHIA